MKKKSKNLILYILISLLVAILIFIIVHWEGFMAGIRIGSEMAE
ncbi:MAG: hypothetical protein PHP30_10090 [Bacteroidales bacterium]|nr:hypothetical protein [Bacteroidales bacterium]MDD3990425.1 hypothetical protein [Bacteroidales bacterium]MDD4639394.1 hypothetical protein [Bacteroidales bacterium]